VRFQAGRNHLLRGGLITLGFFAALVTAAIIPQSALSQFASPTGTNQSLSPGMNIPSNASFPISTPPGGDDGLAKNCVYKNEIYSPGSVVPMPGGNKECQTNGIWL
jgi:hypothetical protein